MKQETLEEINRRQQLIISEPNGIVRETMIANLLIDIEERSYSEEEVLKAQQAILSNIKDALQDENYIIDYLKQFKKK